LRGKALSFLLAGFTLRVHPRKGKARSAKKRNAPNDRFDRRLTLWPSAIARCRGSKGSLAPSRPVSDRAEADAAKTTFLQAIQRTACSGAGMHFRGAASLADVPYWRKT
jgi:hypothetical protein